MSLLTDYEWKIKYTPDDGNLLKLLYVPAVGCARRYDRLTGYFSAWSLLLAARGVEGLVRNDGHMRLVVGCTLNQPEIDAIEQGESLRKTVEAAISRMPLTPDNPEAKDALELLAWMVAKDFLEIKVAIPCGPNRKPKQDTAIFHEKSGIIEDKAGYRLAWSGSLNDTPNGWLNNWESVHAFCDWLGDKRRVDLEDANFAKIWAGASPSLITLDVPTALKEDLLRFLPEDEPERLKVLRAGSHQPERPLTEAILPAVSEPLSDEELRRKVWSFIRNAPASNLPGAERIGEVTSAVVPWPHQARAFERMYRNWPPRLLIADEVGLGKTIQAGLLLRQAWLSGRAKRILILAPKAVLKQWQIELREKFNLNWPIYDGECLSWYPSPAMRGQEEREVAQNEWHREPIVLTSSQLMRRTDRAAELLGAEDWDLVILDEAHHARRRSPGAAREQGTNALLKLMRRLKDKTKGLVLLTATPMQVHPVEVWDLLSLLGLPPEWSDSAFLAFYNSLNRPMPSREDIEELARLFRSMEPFFGSYREDDVAARLRMTRLKAKRLLRILREPSTSDRRSLSSEDLQHVVHLLRYSSPVGRLISRNTRELLRSYFRSGRMSTRIAERDVVDEFLTMTPAERGTYEAVERYIRDTYNQASPEDRSAVGFVMTIYRKRLASSFYALKQTLRNRHSALLQRERTAALFTAEDVPDDDPEQESDDAERLTRVERAALLLDDRSAIEDLLRQVEGLPEDTKSIALRRILGELRDGKYRQVMVFTQFTDTLDFLRDGLLRDTDLKVLCFSGRGGEVPQGEGQWAKITREEVRRRFSRGDADVLLCTDAAAEGLNFQFCGALINYDLPWNPMRVEQRIGRIDRLGQAFDRIRISNLHYDDTIEATVYHALRNRIGMFTGVVGKLQPILSRMAGQIAQAVLTGGAEAGAATVVNNIEAGVAEAERTSFDLDSLLAGGPIEGATVEAPYDLGDLGQILREHTRLLPEAGVTRRSDKESMYQVKGMATPQRVTVTPSYFDDHPDDVELWSPGSPLFPWDEIESSELGDLQVLPRFEGNTG